MRMVIKSCIFINQKVYVQVLVHVSSAYVNSNRDNAEEIIYDAPGDVEKIVHLATTMSDEAVEDLTPK